MNAEGDIKDYTITEPEDTFEDLTQITPDTKKLKPKKKRKEVSDEKPVQPEVVVVEILPEEVVESKVEDETGEIKKKTVSKKTIKKKVGDEEKTIQIVSVTEEGKEEPTTVTVIEDDIEEFKEIPESIATEEIEEKPIPEEDKPKKKKKKKVVRKVKKDDLQEYIQMLIEQEIPKTMLEKYERVELELPQRARKTTLIPPTAIEMTPMKIERHEIKPTKFEVCDAKDYPQIIKLKKVTQKPKTKQVKEEISFKAFKLKSRIKPVPFEPYLHHSEITDLNTIRGQGELSRNIEEAMKIVKRRRPKFKDIVEDKESLEKPSLEIYEKSDSFPEEETPKEKYKRPEKDLKEEKPEDLKKLQIGKGKVSTDDEIPEEVKLKPVKIDKTEEEVVGEKDKPKKIKPEKPKKPKEAKEKPQLEPFEPKDFDEIEHTQEEYEPTKLPDKLDELEAPERDKYQRKKKPKHKQEVEEHPIILGVPKPREEDTEEDIKFRIPESDRLKEDEDKIKLKPFKKLDEEKPSAEEPQYEIDFKPTPTTESDQIQRRRKKPKKEEKPTDVKEMSEEQPEFFEVTVQEIGKKEEVEKVVDKEGIIKEKVITKRKLKKKQGPKEEIIEIITVKEEDKPEFEVTVITSEIPETVEETPEELKPVKKKTVKKVKKDDFEEYITKLIEQEIPEKQQDIFEVKVQEIESKEEVERVTNEEGITKEKVITKRKLKKKQGSKEEIIEIVTVKEEDKPEFEVTVTTSEIPETVEEAPEELKPVKKKTVKKVKKDDFEEYITKLIEQEIPKTELEEYEKVDVGLREKPKKIKKKDIKPEEAVEEKIEEVSVKETVVEEKPKKPKKVKKVEEKPKERPTEEQLEQIEEAQVRITESEVHEEQPEEKVEVTEELPELPVTIKEFEEKPAKPKKKKKVPEKPEEKVVEEVEEKPEEFVVKVQEIEQKVETEKVIDEAGVVIEKTITKRKFKKTKGPKEEIIEVISVQEEGKPESEVTIVTSEVPEAEEIALISIREEAPEEAPQEEIKKIPKKKTVKKVKKEDFDEEYIISLIEQEIPKTELEMYEKVEVEFKDKPKKPKKVKKPEEEIEEKPEEISIKEVKHEEKPKKFKVKKIEEKPEELLPETIEEKPVVVEELPAEIKVIEVKDEEGATKSVTTTKRVIKKKVGDKEEFIHIVTVREIDKPDTLVSVVTSDTPDLPLEEQISTEAPITEKEQRKPKKKSVKKVKQDDLEKYIATLIEQEIPKTELERYEKIDVPILKGEKLEGEPTEKKLPKKKTKKITTEQKPEDEGKSEESIPDTQEITVTEFPQTIQEEYKPETEHISIKTKHKKPKEKPTETKQETIPSKSLNFLLLFILALLIAVNALISFIRLSPGSKNIF